MLIGIVGKKGAGKDTLGDYCVNKYDFMKYSFATPLKQICKILFLLTDEQLFNQNLKECIDSRWNLSPRKMFQLIGTDFMRNQLDKDIWIKHFTYWYDLNKDKNIIITDCRFQNEIDAIIMLGGIIIRIDRKLQFVDNHESEINIDQLKNINNTINNDSDINNLYNQFDRIIATNLNIL